MRPQAALVSEVAGQQPAQRSREPHRGAPTKSREPSTLRCQMQSGVTAAPPAACPHVPILRGNGARRSARRSETSYVELNLRQHVTGTLPTPLLVARRGHRGAAVVQESPLVRRQEQGSSAGAAVLSVRIQTPCVQGGEGRAPSRHGSGQRRSTRKVVHTRPSAHKWNEEWAGGETESRRLPVRIGLGCSATGQGAGSIMMGMREG